MTDLITEASLVVDRGAASPAAARSSVVDLGAVSSYPGLPAPVTVAGRSYFLIRGPGEERLDGHGMQLRGGAEGS
jgi:hypothetical protein